MRLEFQEKPLDIYAALAFAAVVSVILMVIGKGNALGIVLMIFVPGYLCGTALLPRKGDIDWTFRIVLSSGLSLAIVAFLGITLDLTPWGITLPTMVLSILAVSLILGLVAYRRRISLPPGERLQATLVLKMAWWRDYTLAEKILALALAAILVSTVPFLVSALSKPRPTEPYSELYLLGPTGNFTGYPVRLNRSELGSIQIVVISHEGRGSNYTVRVDLVGVQVVYNTSNGHNETVEMNRTTLSTFSPTLSDGGTWTQPYGFSIATAGLYQVQVLLTLRGNLANPYRSVHLLITVR